MLPRSKKQRLYSTLLTVGLLGPVCGSLSAQDALQYPLSIATAENTVYLADRNLPGVWKATDGALSVLFQASKQFRTPMNAVRCVEVDREGRLLVGDSATRDVYRFEGEGDPKPLTREGETFGQIGIPMDIAVDSKGTIYVSDLEIQRIVKLPPEGGKPEEVAQIAGCRGLAVDQDDNLWIISTTNDQLYRLSPGGKPEVVVKGRPFEFPHTVVVDGDGTAFVCDGYAKAIWKVTAGEEPQQVVSGAPLENPVGMTLHDGKLMVVDPRAKKVFRLNDSNALEEIPLK